MQPVHRQPREQQAATGSVLLQIDQSQDPPEEDWVEASCHDHRTGDGVS